MRICFVLPGYTRQPIGGFKMVYIYTNLLSRRGHKVSLLYLNRNAMKQYHVPEIFRRPIADYFTKRGPGWFTLDKSVRIYSGLKRADLERLKGQDIVVATSVDSVWPAKKLFPQTPGAYLIQDFENWRYGDKYCFHTYRAGYRNIAVAFWLKELVEKHSRTEAMLIRNPIDLNLYRMTNPPENRKKHSIGLLYHTMPHKGLKYAFRALKRIKEIYPDLEVLMFGVYKRPGGLPGWIRYIQNASPEQTVQIYNSVSVWLCATVEEGFGLTGLEAMACGAALVSTDYKGAAEYAKNGYNALLSPIKDADGLTENVRYLFENELEKERLINNAQESVKQFSMAYSVEKLEKTLHAAVRSSKEGL